MARLRVGVLGLNHDHVWGNLQALAAGDLGQAVVAADPDPRLRERLAHEHGGVEALASYDALLERADLDVVLIFADNRASAELGVRALDRGLPVMIEKPMAADLAGADAVLAAARKAGLPLMVNWPTVWRPALRHGLTLVRSGAVGEPVQISHRGGHAGHGLGGDGLDDLLGVEAPDQRLAGSVKSFEITLPSARLPVQPHLLAQKSDEDETNAERT